MSESDKQKRADALKNLEAARKGQKRMEQYEDGVSEGSEDENEATLEELLEEKRSSMCNYLDNCQNLPDLYIY